MPHICPACHIENEDNQWRCGGCGTILHDEREVNYIPKCYQKSSWFAKYKDIINIFVLILAIFGTIIAAFYGASYQVQLEYNNDLNKSAQEQKNYASMVYFDVLNLNWTLRNANANIVNLPQNGTIQIVGDIYPETGLYYNFRPQIATFDRQLAYNITLYYTDLIYAQEYSHQIDIAYQKQDRNWYNLSFQQYKFAIQDAYRLQPIITNDLEKRYNISINTIDSRFQ